MASRRTAKSPYARGKRFVLLGVLSMLLVVWGGPILADMLGPWGGVSIVGAISVIWLLGGGIGSFLLGCPRCGKSLFMRGMWSMPWPARTCSKCGYDLTVAERSAGKA